MVDILILGGVIVTMDPRRRVIEEGGVAVERDRIVDVGTRKEMETKYGARRVIDATHMVVMPGLFDGHGHAGHGFVKSMGVDEGLWDKTCEKIYSEGTSEEFWYAEALLTALERLKSGTTCGVTFFGGGDVMQTDDPKYATRHCEALEQIGIREFLAVGPRRPPFPHRYSRWRGSVRRDIMVTFEDHLKTCESIIREWHKKANGRIHICMMFPEKYSSSYTNIFRPFSQEESRDLVDRAQAVRELTRKYNVLFAQDGHTMSGTVNFAHEKLGILGPDALLDPCTNITPEEIEICKKTNTKIVHNPSSYSAIRGRCPVPELIDAGVTVMLGTDGTAPNVGYDMFRIMFHCMHYQRTHYGDPTYIPPGKTLEMATIDAARCLGLERELGSIESGKKADLILVNMFKPHLYPMTKPVHRITYYANGSDVDTVIVDGEVLMEDKRVKTIDIEDLLARAEPLAQSISEKMRGM